MHHTLAEDQSFDKIDFTTQPPAATEFEYCEFLHCQLAGADLSGYRFLECRFVDCDLSNVKLTGVTLNDVRFAGCKLLGVHFEDCSEALFAVAFEGCVLDFSSFYKRQAKKTVFRQCSLQEVDFTDADLTGAVLDGCNLRAARFDNTILEKADLRTAVHFTIDPEINRVRKARFSTDGLEGLLGKYGIDVS